MECIPQFDYPLMVGNYRTDEYAFLPTLNLLQEAGEFSFRSEISEENQRMDDTVTASSVGESSNVESANATSSFPPALIVPESVERLVPESPITLTILNQQSSHEEPELNNAKSGDETSETNSDDESSEPSSNSSKSDSDDASSESSSDSENSVVFLGTKPSVIYPASVVLIDDSDDSTVSDAVGQNETNLSTVSARPTLIIPHASVNFPSAQPSTDSNAFLTVSHTLDNIVIGVNRYEMRNHVQLTTDDNKDFDEQQVCIGDSIYELIGDNYYEEAYLLALIEDLRSDPIATTRLRNLKRANEHDDGRFNETDDASKKRKN